MMEGLEIDGPAEGPSLPLELIHECYRLLFPDDFFDTGVITDKPAWKDLEGLSLASKASHIEDWKTILWRWKRLNHVTRAIHYTSNVYKTPRYLLEPFRRLETLRIDLPTTHVTEEGDFDFAAPEIAQIIHRNIPGNIIRHLEIRGITWLDPFVMRHIAEGLPNLRTLRFRQPLVWCGLCNTIGAPAFASIPARIVYDDGTGLPDGYARFLAPLRHLENVVLTVACGVGSIDFKSLFSYTLALPHAGSIAHNAPRHAQPAQSLIRWTGECESCMHQLLDDEIFSETWRRKASARTSARQSDIDSAQSNHPPSLRRVEWNLLELSNQNWPGLLPAM